MKRMKRNGFSLAELLVVVVLFGLISAAMMMVLMSSQRSWGVGTAQAVLTSELRKALDWMSRDLAQSRPGRIQRPAVPVLTEVGDWDTTAVFRIPKDLNGDGSVLDVNGQIVEWSNDITFALSGRDNSFSRSEINQPGRQPRTLLRVLANHVTDVRFRRRRSTPDVVEIEMTASTITEVGQIMSRTLSTRVKVRN